MEYRDPRQTSSFGLDIDLANELAKRLGVKIIWSETPFAELIPHCRPSARTSSSAVFRTAARGARPLISSTIWRRPAVLRPDGERGEVRHRSLRQEGRHDAQHQLPGRDREVEQAELRGERQVRRAICSRRKQHRCSQPAQAGPHRRCGAGQRNVALRPGQEAGKYRIVGEPFSTGYQASCSGKTMRRCAKW